MNGNRGKTQKRSSQIGVVCRRTHDLEPLDHFGLISVSSKHFSSPKFKDLPPLFMVAPLQFKKKTFIILRSIRYEVLFLLFIYLIYRVEEGT
jgi:hypothetical protein